MENLHMPEDEFELTCGDVVASHATRQSHLSLCCSHQEHWGGRIHIRFNSRRLAVQVHAPADHLEHLLLCRPIRPHPFLGGVL